LWDVFRPPLPILCAKEPALLVLLVLLLLLVLPVPQLLPFAIFYLKLTSFYHWPHRFPSFRQLCLSLSPQLPCRREFQ